jgi:hypothetical protein
MDRAYCTNGQKRNAYKVVVGKSEGKGPGGRLQHRSEDNTKMNLRQDGVVWIGLIWLKIVTSGGIL